MPYEIIHSITKKHKIMSNNKTTIIAEPGKQEIVMTREFDAPRELVFKAYVDPEIYQRWLGPRRLKMKLETFEPRIGGVYRYIHIDTDGSEYAFHGVFHEVSAPERIVCTFEYEGLPEPGHVELNATTFEALPGGRTRLTARAIYLSVADRDGQLQDGMETGVNDSYERLDELLVKG